jgi:HPt (histidine-containing phosphotransfer) domain-containing protein
VTASVRVAEALEAQPAPDNLPRFNPARMNEIAQQAGSDDIVYELVSLFETDVAERLEDLAGAVLSSDKVWRERVAHSIKGSCANLGAERMAKLAERIERCVGQDANQLAVAIQNEFIELRQTLNQRYPR